MSTRTWTTKRVKPLWAAYAKGAKLKDIAREAGISEGRMHEVLERFLWEKYPKYEHPADKPFSLRKNNWTASPDDHLQG